MNTNNSGTGSGTAEPAPPAASEDHMPSRDAGRDETIMERLHLNPESSQARLDRALDESMDGSDPPSATQPVHNNGPAPSSGYDPEAERKLAEKQG